MPKVACIKKLTLLYARYILPINLYKFCHHTALFLKRLKRHTKDASIPSQRLPMCKPQFFAPDFLLNKTHNSLGTCAGGWVYKLHLVVACQVVEAQITVHFAVLRTLFSLVIISCANLCYFA